MKTRRYLIHPGLESFCRLIDALHDRGMVAELDWGPDGWQLTAVWDEIPMFCCETTLPMPACLNILGAQGIVLLAKVR